ncbi:MAG: TIGR03546 family protein [bacterium]
MFWLKQLKKFIKVLNSNASPSQIAMGIALGSIIGFMPFLSLLSITLFFIILMLNVNLSAVFLAIALFGIISFPFDPLADKMGYFLLAQIDFLTPFWTSLYNLPIVPFTRFNNTVVLGSFVIGLILLIPVYFVFKKLVVSYRESWREKLKKARFFQVLGLSKIYNWYQKFMS